MVSQLKALKFRTQVLVNFVKLLKNFFSSGRLKIILRFPKSSPVKGDFFPGI
jgi:hypothetical protein